MSDIINLKRARKAKARAEADAKAEANRVAHGLSKADKKLSKARIDDRNRKLDGHKLRPADKAD